MSQSPFPKSSIRKEALKSARADLISYCRSLSAEQWHLPSKADGWLVKDVVAHLGASCRVIFMPASATMMTTKDIEGWNEKGVEQRKDWPTWRILDEFETWSSRAIALGNVLAVSPLARAKVPVGELGSFAAADLMAGAPVFDQNVHLHHDIAPAVGRAAPAPSSAQMEVAIAWMMAVLANQLRKAPMSWIDSPVNLELTGPGGGAWHIGSDGLLGYGSAWAHSATITSTAEAFVGWGTQRVSWAESDVTLAGSADLAKQVLDLINVV